MGSYYVTKSGNDTTGDGLSVETAWLTIQKAVNTVPDGTHTINIGDGTYDEGTRLDLANLNAAGNDITFQSLDTDAVDGDVVITGSSSCLYGYTGWATGVVFRFKRLTLSGDCSSYTLYFRDSATNNRLSLFFEDCIATRAGASASSILVYHRDILASTWNGCDLIQNTAHASNVFEIINCPDRLLTFANTAFTSGTGNFFGLPAVGPSMAFTNCTAHTTVMQSAARFFYVNSVTTAGTSLTVDGFTFTGAGGFRVYKGFTTVTANNVTATVSAGIAIQIGEDASVAPAAPITTVNASTLRAYYSGTTVSHAILIGKGITGGTVTDIEAEAGDFGLAIKSDSVTFDRVLIWFAAGGSPSPDSAIAFAGGAANNIVKHATVYALGGACVEFREQSGVKPDGNVVTNSIFMAKSGNASSLLLEVLDGQADTHLVGPNLYCPEGGGPLLTLTVQGSASTLEDMQDLWATYGGAGANNDANSVVGNPNFTDPDNLDFNTPYSSRGYGYYATDGPPLGARYRPPPRRRRR